MHQLPRCFCRMPVSMIDPLKVLSVLTKLTIIEYSSFATRDRPKPWYCSEYGASGQSHPQNALCERTSPR